MSTRQERWAAIDDSVRRARELFPILTGAHWARALRWYRSAEGQRNEVREQIQQKILDVKLGKSESGTIEQLTTDYTDEHG
jgi:hypothetical protein